MLPNLFVRSPSLRVCFLDGLIGGGKGLLAPIVSSFKDVNLWLFKPEIELALNLASSNHLTEEVCQAQISSLVNLYSVNLRLGRDLNTRFRDQSSIFTQRCYLKYLRRSFDRSSTARAFEQLEQHLEVPQFMLHSSSYASRPIFNAFNDRLIYIRLNRHPCTEYMLRHIYRWILRWSENYSDGSVLVEDTDNITPFDYVHPSALRIPEFFELPKQPTAIDVAIALTAVWQLGGNQTLDLFKDSPSLILEIPFEKLVLQPFPYIEQISSALDMPVDSHVKREMKRQQIPRRFLNDLDHHPVYAKYGAERRRMSTVEEQETSIEFLRSQNAASSSIDQLLALSKTYESRYRDFP